MTAVQNVRLRQAIIKKTKELRASSDGIASEALSGRETHAI